MTTVDPPGAVLHAAFHLGRPLQALLARGKSTFFAPAHTFKDRREVTLAGVRFELIHAPSEADCEIIAWLPDVKVRLSAEVIQGECFANVHTIRGTRYRDPVQ